MKSLLNIEEKLFENVLSAQEEECCGSRRMHSLQSHGTCAYHRSLPVRMKPSEWFSGPESSICLTETSQAACVVEDREARRGEERGACSSLDEPVSVRPLPHLESVDYSWQCPG